MARAIIPPMKPIPAGATKEDRERLFLEHRAELVALNPHMFNPDGSVKSFWQSLKKLFKK